MAATTEGHRAATLEPTFQGVSTVAQMITRSFTRFLRTWEEHSLHRRCLASLDEHLMQDIGMSDEERRSEMAKPIWRA